MAFLGKDTHRENSAVVISSRIRLARNLKGRKFANCANTRQITDIYNRCVEGVRASGKMRGARLYNMGSISDYDRDMLLETRAISKELDVVDAAKGAFVSDDGCVSVFINEEDHIRIQVLGGGLTLSTLYKTANALDDDIEKNLEFAFSKDIGYITACPTNTGTGMRASVMLHLPALSINNQIEKVVRGLNQLGMVVRGSNGEGSDSYNAYYQLSNQNTLGVGEAEIIEKIKTFCKKICQFEVDARLKYLEDSPLMLVDKFLRARATLENCKLIDTEEALGHLSVLRLAADMNMLGNSDAVLDALDDLADIVQPMHLESHCGVETADDNERDELRARLLNREIARLPEIKQKTFTKRK